MGQDDDFLLYAMEKGFEKVAWAGDVVTGAARGGMTAMGRGVKAKLTRKKRSEGVEIKATEKPVKKKLRKPRPAPSDDGRSARSGLLTSSELSYGTQHPRSRSSGSGRSGRVRHSKRPPLESPAPAPPPERRNPTAAPPATRVLGWRFNSVARARVQQQAALNQRDKAERKVKKADLKVQERADQAFNSLVRKAYICLKKASQADVTAKGIMDELRKDMRVDSVFQMTERAMLFKRLRRTEILVDKRLERLRNYIQEMGAYGDHPDVTRAVRRSQRKLDKLGRNRTRRRKWLKPYLEGAPMGRNTITEGGSEGGPTARGDAGYTGEEGYHHRRRPRSRYA